MSEQLISRSPDLKRLRDEGYNLEIRSKHLLIHDVPYVDSAKSVRRGTLVWPIDEVAGYVLQAPGTHVAYFIGEYPCRADGSTIEGIRHQSGDQKLATDLIVKHSFSAKPKPSGTYPDHYEKALTYIASLVGPAQLIADDVTARTFPAVCASEAESVFKYFDTSSSRAGIEAISAKVAGQKIAIVGVGGTGSYVLDFVAKTPVAEIHLFDGDDFVNHNAFRAPGAAPFEVVEARPRKAAYLRDIYSQMRRGIVAHEAYVGEDNIGELRAMTFVFVCIDRGEPKAQLAERLAEWAIPFLDVGMGVDVLDEALDGMLRVTASTKDKRDHFAHRVPLGAAVADDYSSNIQIVELNALNAALAVIKWKKIYGFYRDSEREHCSVYTTHDNYVVNEDRA